MSEKVEYMVDTKYLVVTCGKFSPKIIVSVDDCKKCEHHKGFELAVKEHPTGKHPALYDVICGLPSRIRTIMHAALVQDKEN